MRRARLIPVILLPIAAFALMRDRSSKAVAQDELAPRVDLSPIGKLPPAPGIEAPKAEPTAAPSPAPDDYAHLVAANNPAEAPPNDRIIRVGLSTGQGPVQFYCTGQMGLTDPTQPERRLVIPSGQVVKITVGGAGTLKAGEKTYTGPLLVQSGESNWAAWAGVALYVTAPPARMTSNGANPRWGRPYRGHFEVWPQRSPEPGHREGDLTVVNLVPLEEYLKGVVPWEMSPSAPLEALKAQAICARTKTLALANSSKYATGGFDVCDYDACQGYPGTENEKPRSTEAVEQTRSLVITYKNRLIDAVYGTNSGGITAAATDVWKSTSDTPYLQSVRDLVWNSDWSPKAKPRMSEADWTAFFSKPWPSYATPDDTAKKELAARRAKSAFAARLFGPDDLPEFYRWKRNITQEEANEAFADRGFANVTGFEVQKRTDSGRIRRLRVFGTAAVAPATAGRPMEVNPTPSPMDLTLEGDGAIRAMLSKKLGSTTALPSSAFSITPETDKAGQVIGWELQGAGWGHGVGLCQRGAQNHAGDGWDARRILKWYYRGVEIKPETP